MAKQGFVSEESLAELEKMAGSLTYGALLILRCKYLGRSATKRQHSDKTRRELVRTRSRSSWRKLDHILLENVRQLWGKYKPGPRFSDISFPENTASADRTSHGLREIEDSSDENYAIVEHSPETEDLDEFELHDSELRPEEPNCSETTSTQIYVRCNEDQLEIAEVNVESAHVISKRSSKTRGWENILKLRRNVVGKRIFNGVAVSFIKEIASRNRDSWAFWIRHLNVYFQTSLGEFEHNALTAFAEIAEPGQYHAHACIPQSVASIDDISRRLAWRVEGFNKEGIWQSWYLKRRRGEAGKEMVRELVNLIEYGKYEDVQEEDLP